MSAHLTIWYNTRCPVCDAGIDFQRNRLLAAVRAGTIEFRDINEQPDALSRYGATLDDIRRRLHATDETDRLIVGEVVMIHIRDGLVNDGKVDTATLDPIARIAGPRYARLGEIVTLRTVFQTSKSSGEETP